VENTETHSEKDSMTDTAESPTITIKLMNRIFYFLYYTFLKFILKLTGFLKLSSNKKNLN
jgi:hypothetical protein